MKQSAKKFALCTDNQGYEASLILGKGYLILPDPKAAKDGLVRIVDESDEGYLYDESHFVFWEYADQCLPHWCRQANLDTPLKNRKNRYDHDSGSRHMLTAYSMVMDKEHGIQHRQVDRNLCLEY